GTRRDHRRGRLRRARRDVPGVAAGALRRPSRRLARARPAPAPRDPAGQPVVNAAASHESGHRPVLLAEVLAALAPRDGATYVDGTFGGGGYSSALLARARCRVFGIDRDPAAVRCGR